MLVMSTEADVDSDIVEQSGVFQPLALPPSEAVVGLGLVEQGQRHPCHLPGVVGKVVAAFGQLDDAPPPHVGVLLNLCDSGLILPNIVEG